MVLLLLFSATVMFGQDQDRDTLNLPTEMSVISADTLTSIDPDTIDHSPRKAIMFALALPGLGQLYNEKYYKIPIVYGALGAAGYAIHFNNTNYKQASLDYALDPSDLNERYLRAWRRNLELSYISLVAVYALQVIDAYVDANLYAWDVSENLSFRVRPDISPFLMPGSTPVTRYGLSCSLRFNRIRE
jgi:hypothetical protein